MILKTIKLRNFRSYKHETSINIDNLTTFIGLNDSGKSTILEALEIFFNNESIKIESSDGSLGGDLSDVRISCIFRDLPATLTIDSRATTTLKDEYLLNSENDLEIVKIFNCGLKTPTSQVYVNANYPTTKDYNDLHSLKNDELKNRLSTLNIDSKGIDQRSNVQIRQAIWRSSTNLNLQQLLVSLEKEDGKKVWEKLKEELPLFALFQSDRASKDEDSEVQDPMKLAVQEAIKSVQVDLNKIKSEVQAKAKEVAQRTLEKLKEMNPALAKDLAPRFKEEPKWQNIFKLSLTDDNQIPINKRGSGTRRLILINFFRAEAERKQNEKKSTGVIYAIEEPETSQHPSNQKLLVEALLDLANKSNSQVLISTHVPGLAGLLPITSLRYIKDTPGGKQLTNNCTDTTLTEISNELGVLPDKRIQAILCVEGPTDVEFFIKISKILNSHNSSFPNLETDKRIAVLPLGGSTLKQWVDNYYSKNIGLPEIHIYDLDTETPPKYKSAVDQVNLRKDGSWATLTMKREIENYFHPDAIQEVFQVKVAVNDTDDIPKLIYTAVNSDSTNKFYKLGDSRTKRILSEQVTPRMTINRINAIDTKKEIEGWFSKLSSLLK